MISDIEELDEIKKDLAKDAGSAMEAVVEAQIAKFSSEKEAVKAFREDLEALAGDIAEDSNFPLVFIVDELDRCRPTFAVTLIERIKHVLDVPGIVFLFVLHRPQLEEAVRCVYGQEIGASGYLAKFIHVWCTLPKQDRSRVESDYWKYCNALHGAHELETWDDDSVLKQILPELSQHFELSLREMERLYSNLAVFYATVQESQERIPHLAAMLAIIRVKYPQIYLGLSRRKIIYNKLERNIPLIAEIQKSRKPIYAAKIYLMRYLMPDEDFDELSGDSDIRKFRSKSEEYEMVERTSVVPYLCSLFDLFSLE